MTPKRYKVVYSHGDTRCEKEFVSLSRAKAFYDQSAEMHRDTKATVFLYDKWLERKGKTVENLQQQFHKKSMSPHRWCMNNGYHYGLWNQLNQGLLTASRGKAKRMKEQLESEGFDFGYLHSKEIVEKRRRYYDLKRAG